MNYLSDNKIISDIFDPHFTAGEADSYWVNLPLLMVVEMQEMLKNLMALVPLGL